MTNFWSHSVESTPFLAYDCWISFCSLHNNSGTPSHHMYLGMIFIRHEFYLLFVVEFISLLVLYSDAILQYEIGST